MFSAVLSVNLNNLLNFSFISLKISALTNVFYDKFLSKFVPNSNYVENLFRISIDVLYNSSTSFISIILSPTLNCLNVVLIPV